MFNKFKYLALLIIATQTAVTSLICQAENSQSFFPGKERDVRNIFGKELKIEKAYYKQDENKLFQDPKDANSAKLPETPQEKIIAEFGDPKATHEVKAISDAPKPFRAMIEALKVGDKPLALEYAVQYQKYLGELEKINQDAASIQGIAMYKNGTMPEESWVKTELQNNPDLMQFINSEPKI